MACRRCGSDWKTIHGADTASCPSCCKLQRCRARKKGRLPSNLTESRQCQYCGGPFQVATPSEKARSKYCSDECRKKARLLWSREYQRAVAAGDRAPKATEGRLITNCLACNTKLKSGQYKYCSNACFVQARSDGIQSWDRSKTDAAACARPSNVSQSPWRHVPNECITNARVFLRRVSLLRKSAAILHDCKNCGRLCLNGSKTVCSNRCGRKLKVNSTCTDCGESFAHSVLHKRRRCKQCSRQRKHKYKNRLSANNRKRCRKFGVPFDPSIKARDVCARDNHICHICRRKVLPVFTKKGSVVHPRSPSVDHLIPLSAGIKGHTWDNVRCACFECNWKKGAEWSGQLSLPLIATVSHR